MATYSTAGQLSHGLVVDPVAGTSFSLPPEGKPWSISGRHVAIYSSTGGVMGLLVNKQLLLDNIVTDICISGDVIWSLMVDGVPWSREECMLALWAYSVVDRNRDVRGFVKADVYREVTRLTGRKVSAVSAKLNNVAACDPRERGDKPVSIWDRVQGLLAELYAQYGHDASRLDEFHQQYSYRHEFGPTGKEVPTSRDEALIIEGEIVDGFSTHRKRSVTLLVESRKYYRKISPDGLLRCAACGTTFDGMFDREIIHIHHLEPISEIKVATRAGLKEALDKVVPLCPTCHAIAHTRAPPVPVDEVREMIIHR